MKDLIRYLLQSLASFKKAKGFVATVIVTLGITSATFLTIIAIASAVFLNPLPYGDEERIFLVNQITELDDYTMKDEQSTNTLNYWYENQTSFEYFSPLFIFDVYLEDAHKQPLLSANFVTSDYFEIFDVPLLKGRVFNKDEDNFSANSPNILIGEKAWHEYFEGREDIIGATVSIFGQPRRIIGVVEEGFKAPNLFGGAEVSVWMPWSVVAGQKSWTSTFQNRRAIGQIKSGLDEKDVEQSLAQLLAGIESEWKGEWPQLNLMGADLINIREVELGNMQMLSTFLLIGALGLLIIATANTSNLFFTRTVERTSMMALRVIVGAQRKDLFKAMFIEALLICFVAVFTGGVIAYVILDILPTVMQSSIPMLNEFSIDYVVLFSALVIVLSLASLFAFNSLRTINFRSLKSHIQASGKGVMGGVSATKMRVFIIAQVAIATIVLLGGSLFLAKAISTKTHDLGFDTRGFYHFHAFAGHGQLDQGRQNELENQIRNLLLAQDDIADVGIALVSPFRYDRYTRELTSMSDESLGVFPANFVDEYFLSATDVEVIEGRNFNDLSGQAGYDEVMVSEALAAKLGGNVVGSQVKAQGGTEYLIVGVVEDGFHPLFFDQDKGARVYFPKMALGFPMAVRMQAGATLDKEQANEWLRTIDSNMFIYEFHDVHEEIQDMLFIDSLLVVLISSLMGITLLLSAVGIIGVLSYNMKLRKYEIGIRLAVGAQRKHLYLNALTQISKSISFGFGIAVVGIVAVIVLVPSHYGEHMMVSPLLLSGLLSVIVSCCLFATLFPVYRMLLTKPHQTLKGE